MQPHVIQRVRTAEGKLLYQRRNANNGRVIEPQYVAMMNQMMEETLLTGTAHKAELPGWQAAGKTGTSQDWRDAWFVGYTSYLVAGVWLGNDDGSPTKKVSGGNLPVEIWSRFMKEAHQGVPPAGLPLGDWRSPDAPPPEPPPPNFYESNAGKMGHVAQQNDVAAAPLELSSAPAPAQRVPVLPLPPAPRANASYDVAPIPPASIPLSGSPAGPTQRDRNLLGRLLGSM